MADAARMPDTTFDPNRQILGPRELPVTRLADAFEHAARAAGYRELFVRVAGHCVRIRVAGSALADVVAASMGHLAETERTEPVLTIDWWDVAATGVAAPAHAIDTSQPPILMKSSETGDLVGEERHHGATWLDRGANRIVGFTQSAALLNLDERARPFHKMLAAWLEDRGVQFVHAGLIEHAGRGVLFVGNGGAGKSTSSIACLRAGMGYLGDDFIGLGVADERFVGHGLYASCLLNVHHIERFPDLKPLGHAPHHACEEKCVLYLTQAFPGSLRRRIDIDALVLPRVVSSDATTFRRAGRAEVLRAIAPTSVMLLPRPNRAAFDRLVQLVERTPGYWLELGRSVDRIPDAVRTLAEVL